MTKQSAITITVGNDESESESSALEDVLDMSNNEDYTLEDAQEEEKPETSLSWDTATRRAAAELIGDSKPSSRVKCVVCYNAGSFKESAMAACLDAIAMSIPYRPVQDKDVVCLQKLILETKGKVFLILLGASGWQQDQIGLLQRLATKIVIVTWVGEKHDLHPVGNFQVVLWQDITTKLPPATEAAKYLLFTLGEVEIFKYRLRNCAPNTGTLYHGIPISQRPPGKDLLLGLEAVLRDNLQRGQGHTMYSTVRHILTALPPAGFQSLESLIGRGREERKLQTERQRNQDPGPPKRGRHRAGVKVTLREGKDERQVTSKKRKILHPEPLSRTAELAEQRASAYYKDELRRAERRIVELERQLDEQMHQNPIHHPYLHNPFFPPLPPRPVRTWLDVTDRRIQRDRRNATRRI